MSTSQILMKRLIFPKKILAQCIPKNPVNFQIDRVICFRPDWSKFYKELKKQDYCSDSFDYDRDEKKFFTWFTILYLVLIQF